MKETPQWQKFITANPNHESEVKRLKRQQELKEKNKGKYLEEIKKEEDESFENVYKQVLKYKSQEMYLVPENLKELVEIEDDAELKKAVRRRVEYESALKRGEIRVKEEADLREKMKIVYDWMYPILDEKLPQTA